MGTIPFWDETPGHEGLTQQVNEWDRVTIGGQTMPGLAHVEAKPQCKTDHKDAPGSHGANPTFHGYKPAPVTITLTVWTPAQWNDLETAIKRLWPAATKQKPKPVDVYHPALAVVSIKSIVIMGIDTPKDGKFHGSKVITIHAVEFLPSSGKPATTTPKASLATLLKRIEVSTTFRPPNPQPNASYDPVNVQQSLPSQDKLFSGP